MELTRLVIFPSTSQSVKQAKVPVFSNAKIRTKKITRHMNKQGNKAQRNKMNLHKLTKKKWRSMNHLTYNSMIQWWTHVIIQLSKPTYNSKS